MAFDMKKPNCWNCKFVAMKDGLTFCKHKPDYGEDREPLATVCKNHAWKKGMSPE